MTFDIKKKTAVVTGANRGIGLAIVHAFLHQGAKKVYLAVRDPGSVTSLTEQYGDRVAVVQVDVADKQAIEHLAAQTTDAEVVVNNAGVLKAADVNDPAAVDALIFEFNTNTLGLLRMAQAYQPILAKQPSAAFVQLNSVASIKNFAPFTTYSASKAATYSLTQGLKDSWADQGIQVLSVHPGPIATDMAKSAGMEDGADPVEVVADGIVQALHSGQFHLFPDSLAKTFEAAYHGYAENIIEPLPEAS